MCLLCWVVFSPKPGEQFSRAWESGLRCWFCPKTGNGTMKKKNRGPKQESGKVGKNMETEFEGIMDDRRSPWRVENL